jgi:tetratricopeptide (TPR) repeat protein
MTAERWTQIRQLFDTAMEQPAGNRELYVRELSNQDSELREEALAMLRNSGDGGALLDLSLLGRQWIRPATVARTLHPGQILAGRYRIVRPIGAGGMGEVYEAEDLDLGARVAVKTMRLDDEDSLSRFKHEIHLARTVTHPNVCRIFDLHRHHDVEMGTVVTFLTMELVEGETLSVYLARRGALTAAEALPIAEQIALALSAAHQKHVVHRDLKPGNVILTEGGTKAVVTDFGLAYTLTQATESTVTVVGTPAYMAPEQFEGKPITAAADIYAFGVLLYEMVVGRRPFAADTPIALAIEKIRTEPPRAGDAVPSLPPVWSAVIRKCLDPQPERRFGDVLDALHRLQESVGRRPLIRLSHQRKRALAAVLLVTAVFGVAAWRYTQSVYSASGEALRLYRLGTHAYQLGLAWKATQLYENALEQDTLFTGARAYLAEAWMDLDQPRRARAELERARRLRPRWQRVAPYESLLAQAAQARLRGDSRDAVRLHQRATGFASASEIPDALFAAAAATYRAGDVAGALERYKSAEQNPRCRCTAILAHAVVSLPLSPPSARVRLRAAASCFEAAGDLDGVAQSWYESGLAYKEPGGAAKNLFEPAMSIAQSSGNIELQIAIAAALASYMQGAGDEEAAYASFSHAMQIADRHDLKFLSARLLSDRAQYFFDKEEFLQSEGFNEPASMVSQSAAMPWTYARCQIRQAALFLRMELPDKALLVLDSAREQLQQFPNDKLAAELARLAEVARHSRSRPEK